MNNRTVEIGVGLFVALGIAALFMLAMQVSNLGTFISPHDSYLLKAGFENIGGLKVRSPVTVSGVRVGRVAAIDYDDEAFEAVVTLRINPAMTVFRRIPRRAFLRPGCWVNNTLHWSRGGRWRTWPMVTGCS